MANRKLTGKQARFVAEYLVDLNATQAAIRAGYSARTAEVIGAENLRKPGVAREIDAALKRRNERVEVKQDDVLREYLRLAMVDIGDAFDAQGRLKPFKDMSVDVRRAISSVKVLHGDADGLLMEVKFCDKKGSLDSLARHLGMFKDKLEVSADSSLAELLKEARARAQRR